MTVCTDIYSISTDNKLKEEKKKTNFVFEGLLEAFCAYNVLGCSPWPWIAWDTPPSYGQHSEACQGSVSNRSYDWEKQIEVS